MTTKLNLTLMALGIALSTISPASAQVADPIPLIPVAEPSSSGLSVIYTLETGNVSVNATGGTSLTAIQLNSLGSLFNGNCDNLVGGFDVCDDDKIFTLNTDGFESIDLGNVLDSEIPWQDLQADLLVNGASVGGGFDVGDGPFLAHAGVPEPSGLLGLMSGVGLLIAWRRRTSRG